MQNKANTSLIKKTFKHAYVTGRVGVAVEAIVGGPVGIEPINKVFKIFTRHSITDFLETTEKTEKELPLKIGLFMK